MTTANSVDPECCGDQECRECYGTKIEISNEVWLLQTERGILVQTLKPVTNDGIKYVRASTAATSMRSACVEKVKAIRDEWIEEAEGMTSYEPAIDYSKRDAANEIIAALESVSIP